ncbi:MAG: restriction endonuclease subunit S [Clostridiales bacterium]|nr:restriction endonuclease subunit S [Clostridiales bacterium]
MVAYFSDATKNTVMSDTTLKWCSVSLAETIENGKRLDASVFAQDARQVRDKLEKGRYQTVCLYGAEDSMIEGAFYPARFKRIYCGQEEGVPFLLPSQITEISPKADKFISPFTPCSFDELRLKYGDLLLTRSGTIGNCTIVSKTLEGRICSDDVIRITPKNETDLGYLYAYLNSSVGQTILQTNRYGSVIQHIEPEHLAKLPVPKPPFALREKIGSLILTSFALRDESNDLVDEATALLKEVLHLQPLSHFKNQFFDNAERLMHYQIQLDSLDERLDASYHDPMAEAILAHLRKHCKELVTIADKRISDDVVLPGRFKRVYVDKAFGVKFIGGKEIHQLNPATQKYLSLQAHKKQLAGPLGIKPNSILTPARGSLGSVSLTCRHFCDWAISDNVMQILSNDSICGYLYIFLNSEYGERLIRRQTYGGVVDAIEPFHIKRVAVPLLHDDSLQKKINRMALEANEKRYKAYLLEQQALALMDREVIEAR